MRSDEYFDLVTQLNRSRPRHEDRRERERGVAAPVQHAYRDGSAEVREQLTRVERQLNKVGKALGDSEEASEEPRRQLAAGAAAGGDREDAGRRQGPDEGADEGAAQGA